jgi:hypothetical protein
LLCGATMVWLLMRIYGKEITRVAGERDSLQKQLLEGK